MTERAHSTAAMQKNRGQGMKHACVPVMAGRLVAEDPASLNSRCAAVFLVRLGAALVGVWAQAMPNNTAQQLRVSERLLN
jgi:hypothetical protein